MKTTIRTIPLVSLVIASLHGNVADGEVANPVDPPAALNALFANFQSWKKSITGPGAERVASLDSLQTRFQRHVVLLFSLASKADDSQRAVLLEALVFVSTIEAKLHDAYMMEQFALWTQERKECEGLSPMAFFPIYRTGLQAASQMEHRMLALEMVDLGKEYDQWVFKLGLDLGSARKFFWKRAVEVCPEGGEWMLRNVGLRKPRD